MFSNPKFTPLFGRFPQLRLIGDTRLVRIPLAPDLGSATVEIKAEMTNPGGSLKDRPVLRILLQAMVDGHLTPDREILDSSSGNAGIAYAMIGSLLGLKVRLVVSGNASRERLKRIAAHGASLVLTDPTDGYDEALRTCHKLYQQDPNRYFFADQYSNDNNWLAHYETTAVEIIRQTDGGLTHFVAGVGTGGSITGIGRRLKEFNPKIRIVAVVPAATDVIEGLKPLNRPEDIRPKILDPSVIDETVEIEAEVARQQCRRLARQGLFAGQSTGASLAAVESLARRERHGRFVTLACDTGERYFSTGLWDA